MDVKGITVTGKGYSKIYSNNPFYEEPPPRAFYHPSKERKLTSSERKTVLSPERAGSKSSKQQTQAPDQQFLAGGHKIKPLSSIQHRAPVSPPSDRFDESWPESARPSSPSVLQTDESRLDTSPTAKFETVPVHPRSTSDLIESALLSGHPSHQADVQDDKTMEKDLSKTKAGKEEKPVSAEKGSVLQRYIERFRHGAPMSREERLQKEGDKKKEFWWLESDPPTSTSTPKNEGRSVSLTFHGQGTGLTVENLKKRDGLDEATERLQEKADRLLSSAHSVASSEPVVSTDGLGSTGSDISSFSEPAVRPAFVSHRYTETSKWSKPLVSSGKDSEDDILYKWRLQRKLEQARKGAAAAPVSIKPAPQTQAEQEMSSRLAAFREKLLRQPLVASAEVRHAQAERVIRETQTQMDTSVQTSPPATPSWSYNKRSETSAQADTHELLAAFGLKDSEAANIPSQPTVTFTKAPTDSIKSSDKMAAKLKNTGVDRDKENGDAYVEDKVPSEEENFKTASSKQVDSETLKSGACSPHSSPRSADSKYRQYLPAEKPHVDGEREMTLKKQHAKHDVGDNVLRQNGRESPVSSSSEKSERSRGLKDRTSARARRTEVTDVNVGDFRQPCSSGDFSGGELHEPSASGDFTNADIKSKRSSSKTESPRRLRDADADSDGSNCSRHSSGSSKGQRKRSKESKSVPRSHHYDHEYADEERGATHVDRRRERIQENRGFASSKSERLRKGESPSEVSRASKRLSDGGDLPMPDVEGHRRSQGARSERSGQVPPPQYSSSPARGSLASAIGQVVQDRLFDGSGSVLSSVDSFSSSLLLGPQHSPQPRTESSDVQPTTSSESVYESDGEFESDPLLQLLRQQRQNYEMKLRELDSLIAERGRQDDDS